MTTLAPGNTQPYLTVDESLVMEETSSTRHECVGGVVLRRPDVTLFLGQVYRTLPDDQRA